MDVMGPSFPLRRAALAAAPLVTLEGAALVKNTGYRAAVKPVARAHFEKDLLWYSTLESAAAPVAWMVNLAVPPDGTTR